VSSSRSSGSGSGTSSSTSSSSITGTADWKIPQLSQLLVAKEVYIAMSTTASIHFHHYFLNKRNRSKFLLGE